ncbi:MAG: DUF4230 domain-containing protein [Eggerthellaceae bacterium]|jgi:hypothetical protein|nr:DUF4230 domain-containing protein [Eggerthellaceae bacterium]MCH4220746.1 DUF4230 domain-containing protein [Eggerthellaceae bacterium]
MKHLIKWIVILIIAIALFVGGYMCGVNVNQSKQPTITSTAIQTELTECSDLATDQLNYRGLIHYASGSIPLIDQKEFNMVYNATVKAGVDLSQTTVTVEGKTITVTLPQASIQSISIDPDSIEFYDQSFALTNWDNKMDTAQALSAAKDDVHDKVDQTTMLETAENHADDVVQNLLAPFTNEQQGYTLTVVHAS